MQNTNEYTDKWLRAIEPHNPDIIKELDGKIRIEWKSKDGIKLLWVDIADNNCTLFADTGFYSTIDDADMSHFRVYGIPLINAIRT